MTSTVSFSTIVQRKRPAIRHNSSDVFKQLLTKLPSTVFGELPNKVRFAHEHYKSPFTTITLYNTVGTRHEPESGMCQMLETLNLRSTENLAADKLALAVEELGGHLSVDTGREHTAYTVKVRNENANKAMSLLSDMTKNGGMSDESMEWARAKVLHRIKTADEDPDYCISDMLHRTAYDSTDTGLGSPIMGTAESVKQLTSAQLKDFRKKQYTGPRTIITAAGGMQPEKLEALVKDGFGDLEASDNTPTLETRFVGGDMKLWNLRYKVSFCAFAVETCGYANQDSYPLQLCKHIFGRFHRSQQDLGQHAAHRVLKLYSAMDQGGAGCGMSHFHERAIEFADAQLTQYSDSGMLGHYFGTRPEPTAHHTCDTIHVTIQYLMHEWCRLAQKAIEDAELEQAKANMKSQLLFNMDGGFLRTRDLGKQIAYTGRRMPLEESFARIDDISVDNVQETLYHYWFCRRPAVAYLGYNYPLPGYDMIQHWTYKFWY